MPSTPDRKKGRKEEITQMVYQIIAIILSGSFSNSDIIQEINKNNLLDEDEKKHIGWLIDIDLDRTRAVQDYIKDARLLIGEGREADKAEMKNLVTTCIMDIYKEARTRGELRTALRALENISKLNGLEQIRSGSNFNPAEYDIPVEKEEDKRSFEIRMASFIGMPKQIEHKITRNRRERGRGHPKKD